MFRAASKAAVALLAALAVGTASAEDEITLRVADNLPTTHFLAKYGTTYFMEGVTKATNGRVKFQYYPSEQLGKAKDMLTLLKSGVADIALVVPSYMSEQLPLSGVVDLPGRVSSSCEGTMAYSALLEDDGFLARNEFKKNGVRKVFVYVNPPYELFLAGDGQYNLLDLAGRKVRSVGGALDLTVRELNGVPVRMAAPEIRESLSRGTVDGIIFPVPTVKSYKLEGLISTATRGAKLASVATGYMISEKAWQKLPDDVKAAIEKVGEEATRRVCDLTDKDITTTYEGFKEKDDIKVVAVTEEQQEALKPIYEKVRIGWAKQLDDRGLPGSEALEAFDHALGAPR